MGQNLHTNRSPLIFFLLLFVISIPFWFIGAIIEPTNIPVNLPISALAAFNPMVVAMILIYRETGIDAVKRLLQRIFDYRRIQSKIWYLPIFLLMPLLMLIEYGLMNLLGNSIPNPQFPILMIPVLFVVFFIAALGEELGWQGYAFEPLQARSNALEASLLLGIVWATWHIVPYIQTHNPANWIVSQCVASVGLRVLIVWVYKHTGKSLFAAILFHTMINVSNFMFPNFGSYYDPFIASILVIIVVTMIVWIWGAKNL